MNADDRLDQLEPLVSEALNVLDRHTLQLKQLSGAVNQLTGAVAQQGDNISFILREQMAVKADIADIKTEMTGMKTEITGMKTEITGMKTEITGMNGKIDLLVQLIQSFSK